jgi:hypothetical protein
MNGYHPRADRDLPNRKGGFVIPTPAELYPVAAAQNADFVDDDIARKAMAAMNNLAYLYSINPERFGIAMNALASDVTSTSDNRAALIRTLAGIVAAWTK